MRIYVGVTDNSWFSYLSSIQPDEVNFWQPRDTRTFGSLTPGELFLFKLKAPHNCIAGGSIFVRQALLPLSLAWEAFGNKNGSQSFADFIDAIYRLRGTNRLIDPDPVISSLILTQPFFLEEAYWIPVPSDFSRNLVQGKTYDTSTKIGRDLYETVRNRLQALHVREANEPNRFGEPQIVSPRLGQGAFRVIITENYNRRCAITGERTLPVLEASHIKPFSQNGPHAPHNGLLLRQDMHTLFDRGYLTINEDYQIEVSRRIKEDYGNGRAYYAYHGKPLVSLPGAITDRPARELLLWHNENVYVG